MAAHRAHNEADPPIQGLLQYLCRNTSEGRTGTNHEIRTSFISIQRVNDYFGNETRTKALLHALLPDKPLIPDPKVVCQEYSRVLCILVRLNKGYFITHFMLHQLSDAKLPFDSIRPDQFPESGPNGQFFHLFRREQWQFCAPMFRLDMNVSFVGDLILPIEELEQHKEGSTATVYKIRIHRDYDLLYNGVDVRSGTAWSM